MTRTIALSLTLVLTACAGNEPAPEPPASAQGSSGDETAASAQPTPAEGAPETASAAPRIAIPNAAQPEPGLLTGGPPSVSDLQAAAAAGYRTVISLQTAEELDATGERAHAEAAGLRFVSIPIAGAADLTEEKARELGAVIESEASKPAILHCGTGNRAGALLALEAFYVRGIGVEDAIELGKRAGLTKLEPAVREHLQAAANSR